MPVDKSLPSRILAAAGCAELLFFQYQRCLKAARPAVMADERLSSQPSASYCGRMSATRIGFCTGLADSLLPYLNWLYG
jgi:hypothetical protein